MAHASLYKVFGSEVTDKEVQEWLDLICSKYEVEDNQVISFFGIRNIKLWVNAKKLTTNKEET